MKHFKYVVIVIALAMILYTMLMVVRNEFNVSTPLVVVEGNSMIPTLYNGDLVLIHKPSPDKIHVGDIIVYFSPSTSRLVIHRVIHINTIKVNNIIKYYYVTRGDNNPINDVSQGLEPVTGIPYEDILGVVISVKIGDSKAPLRIPYLGLLTRLVRG